MAELGTRKALVVKWYLYKLRHLKFDCLGLQYYKLNYLGFVLLRGRVLRVVVVPVVVLQMGWEPVWYPWEPCFGPVFGKSIYLQRVAPMRHWVRFRTLLCQNNKVAGPGGVAENEGVQIWNPSKFNCRRSRRTAVLLVST